MNIKKVLGTNVLVYGVSKSGRAVAEYLSRKGIRVSVYDDDQSVDTHINSSITRMSVISNNVLIRFTGIVISPSIRQNNVILDQANKWQIPIYSEIEIGAMCAKSKIIAVTGTNGKTTTVELTNAILSKQMKSNAVGNIGYPITQALLDERRGVMVTEVSSYMLENASYFKPSIATITNITPDHLDRYETIGEYADTKLKIFQNFNKKHTAIINADDQYSDIIKSKVDSKTMTYSRTGVADVHYADGKVYKKVGKKSKLILSITNATLMSAHNISNTLCAVCVGLVMKVRHKLIAEAISEYILDHHRYETIGALKGVTYINDSKSTNVDSTINAVNATTGSIHLLLGGSEKGLDYNALAKSLYKHVKHVYCFGEIGERLASVMTKHKVPCNVYATMKAAVMAAKKSAKKSHTILLSPASASFDEYQNYEERGNDFVKIYQELSND